MMWIGVAAESDKHRILDLVLHFLDATPYGDLIPPSLSALQDLIDFCLREGIIFIAEIDGQVEGFIAAVLLPHPVTGQRYADELAWWVEPAHRASLVGPKLLRSCELWARQQGATMLKMVAPSGTDVGRFYERLGYTAVETAYVKRL